MSLRFHLPSLALTNPDRPGLHDPGNAEASGASLDGAQSALWQFDPLLRGLLLAGYELEALEIGISSGSAPSTWSVVDLPTMELQAGDSAGRNWPSGAKLTVAVVVRERVSLTLMPFAIPLNLVGGQLGGAAPGTSTRLEYSTSNPVSDAADLAMALNSFGVDVDAETIANELADRWSQATEPENLNPFTFSTPPGLLWMFYPQYWYREPTAEPNSRYIHEMSLQLAGAISAAPLDFFRLQINRHQNNAETEQASVHGVADTTGVRVQMYFIKIGKLSDALGGLMSEEWYWNLAGPEPIGHPSTVRYFEVLLHIAEAGLFPFPALADSEIPSHYDFEDPLEVWMLQDGQQDIGVSISVYGSEPLEIVRAVDIGYEVKRCFTWEYRDPDDSGLAQLVVVAGPGVWISGDQNIAGLQNCDLRIYRVQDPDLIPAWGEKIYEQFFWASHDHGRFYWNSIAAEDTPAADDDPPVGPQPGAGAAAYGVAAFRVQQRPDGVRINYPAEKGDEESELIIDLKVHPTSPFHRFCYDFQEGEGQMGDRQRQVVRVWATEGVEITVVHDFAMGVAVDEHYWRLREPPVPQGGQFDGRTLREMPLPGVTLPPAEPPAHLNPFMLEQGDLNYGRTHLPDVAYWIGSAKFVGQMVVDIGIGFTPVGDVVDLLDFTQSLFTGKDKWGNPVTNFDRALMLAGVLPFVSSGALRAASRMRGPL